MSPLIDPRYAAKHYAAIDKEREDAQRAATMEYVKPVLMLTLGLGFVVIWLLSNGSEADGEHVAGTTMAGVYLLRMGFELICGVIGLWLAAKLWLGGVGPLGLAILRLAGIYAFTDATAIIAHPLLMIGWLISVAVYIGTLMWLFELEAADSLMLAAITYILKVVAGVATMFALASH